MNNVNLHERMVIHLRKYHNVAVSGDYIAPMEITQDGISMALGISRNHTSVVLSKMQKNGEVDFSISRIRYSESGIRRKAYFLTPKGLELYETVMDRLHREGVDEEEIMRPGNINYFSGEMMDTIPAPEMDIIGMVSVIRCPVGRSTLRCEIPKTLPFDSNGDAFVKQDTRNRMISRNKPSTLRRWHSLAADWCSINCKDVRERIVHLMEAGRTIEAERVVKRNMYVLMDNPSEELVTKLTELMDGQGNAETAYVVAMMSIRIGMFNEARKSIESLRSSDNSLAGAMESEMELVRGNNDRALDLALQAYRGDMETGLALGKSMAVSKRYGEALVFLRRSRKDMRDRRCIFRMDEELRIEAMVMERIGDNILSTRLAELAESLDMRMGPGCDPRNGKGVSEHCVLL